jgi:hypothetical protein
LLEEAQVTQYLFTIRHGELLDVVGSPIRYSDVTIVPARVELYGTSFSPTFNFLDWCHGNVRKVPSIVHGDEIAAWVLGRLIALFNVESNTIGSDKIENVRMGTYDAKTKTYRRWSFDSTGGFTESLGHWEEATKTMTWEGEAGDEIPVIMSVHVMEPNRIEWTLVAKDKFDRILLDFEGKALREPPKAVR